ncbi:MAG: ATP-binding cassette domain-containing protein [Zetaproteobacteria bacterium]|nr:MAG: ATP-binding cassette domain-containing protein [Zetaproteobacteria bacterium]
MLRTEALCKRFGAVTALEEVEIAIPERAITVIMGGSGSGKTTLLRLLSGLERPSCGAIYFEGRDLAAIPRRELYRLRMKMGMVFQYSALLNSLTVEENIAFPLREHTRLDPRVIHTIVTMKLEQVGLRGFGHLLPSELSGGMAKRVAFARALAMDPKLVFFDEPTSGLDPISAGVITELIRRLTRLTHMTSVVVTHDVHAGLAIADHVLLLWQGRVIASGPPEAIRDSGDARIRQFLEGRPDGPIPFSRSDTDYLDELLAEDGA